MDRLRSKSAAGAERLKLKLQAVLNNNRSGTITKLSEFCDLQVGTKVYFNVPRRMRKELWLSILHSRSGSGLDARNRFPELIAKGVTELVADEIDKDTKRTFPDLEALNTPARQRDFAAVLRAYAAYDTEVGYCQGMNFLAGLLLLYVEEPADAFGLLVVLLTDRRLRELYKPDMSMLQARLWHLNKLMPPVLSVHLESHAVMPVLYASSWLMTCFASDFPAPFAARVMDTVLCNSHLEPLMKVAVCVLRSTARRLQDMDDMEEMVELLKVRLPAVSPEAQQRLLTEALGSPWTMHDRQLLCQIEGVESVAAALERVEAGAAGMPPREQPLSPGRSSAGAPNPVAGGGVSGMPTPADAELLSDFEERLEAKYGSQQTQGSAAVTRLRTKPVMSARPAPSTGATSVPRLSGPAGQSPRVLSPSAAAAAAAAAAEVARRDRWRESLARGRTLPASGGAASPTGVASPSSVTSPRTSNAVRPPPAADGEGVCGSPCLPPAAASLPSAALVPAPAAPAAAAPAASTAASAASAEAGVAQPEVPLGSSGTPAAGDGSPPPLPAAPAPSAAFFNLMDDWGASPKAAAEGGSGNREAPAPVAAAVTGGEQLDWGDLQVVGQESGAAAVAAAAAAGDGWDSFADTLAPSSLPAGAAATGVDSYSGGGSVRGGVAAGTASAPQQDASNDLLGMLGCSWPPAAAAAAGADGAVPGAADSYLSLLSLGGGNGGASWPSATSAATSQQRGVLPTMQHRSLPAALAPTGTATAATAAAAAAKPGTAAAGRRGAPPPGGNLFDTQLASFVASSQRAAAQRRETGATEQY